MHAVYKLYVMFTTILRYANVLHHYKGMHLLLVTESQVHIYSIFIKNVGTYVLVIVWKPKVYYHILIQ